MGQFDSELKDYTVPELLLGLAAIGLVELLDGFDAAKARVKRLNLTRSLRYGLIIVRHRIGRGRQ